MKSRTVVRMLVSSTLVATAILADVDAAAQSSAAEAAFRRAREEYEQGSFDVAASDFELAFHEDPRAAVIYNAALSWQLGDHPAQAADDYAQALALRDLSAEQAADATARLQALEATLGRVRVVAAGPGARISLAHASGLPSPATVHVATGGLDVLVTWPDGQRTSRSVTVVPAELVTVEIGRPVEPVQASPGVMHVPREASAVHHGYLPLAMYGAGALAVVGVAVGSVFGLMTLSTKQTVDAGCGVRGVSTSCKDSSSAAAGNNGQVYGTVSTAAFVTAGVAAATAVVLWIVKQGSDGTERRIQAQIGPIGTAGVGAGVGGSW